MVGGDGGWGWKLAGGREAWLAGTRRDVRRAGRSGDRGRLVDAMGLGLEWRGGTGIGRLGSQAGGWKRREGLGALRKLGSSGRLGVGGGWILE